MAIEREKILETALDLLNEVGLDKLTTRKIAERLGVQQPALYWHFRSKGDLLDALNAEILARYHTHRSPLPGERWDEFTLAHARSFRRALLSVRNGARINAGTRPGTTQFADAEKQLQLYVEAGFSPAEAFNISIAVARYVVGFVLEEQDERAEEEAPGLDPMEEVARFPLLSGALRPLIAKGTINTEAVFEGGLAYMLAGMRESLAGRRRKKKAAPGGAA
jgi:TetR/AcrR family tetracycline transcriptional repressor